MGKTAGHKAAGCSQEQGREVGMDATVKKELAAEATSTAKGVQTYKEREDKKKRMKNNPWKTSSRKLRYRGHKKPVRTSTKVYNVGKMKAMYMNSFLRLPGVREALSARRNAVLRHEAAPRKPEVIVIDDDGDDLWPMGVDKISASAASERIVLMPTPVTTHNFAADEEQTCDYALELQLKSTRGKKVYINATSCGGITRMLNYSCDARCHFVELRNRENVDVVVVAKRTIEEGEEVTVDYVDPWFDCVCGAANCRG
ncbi:SET domain-containing protein [Phytophthora infestans]|uniref:SET domain-containing protein n=1 Tax=Phytophthora infestans TaxID=4787 RepID=A0A8S9U0F0_PHYIN|nr:SET domain-containing protein [Phytophthora infestans]